MSKKRIIRQHRKSPHRTLPKVDDDSLAVAGEDSGLRLSVLINEGARMLRAGRAAEALPPLEEALTLAPDDPDVLINLGGALVMNGKWRRAVAVLEAAVALFPDNAQIWLNLAAAYLGRLEISGAAHQDRAIAAYQRAIEIDPAAPSAHYNLGLIYAERRDWPAAVSWFRAAVQVDPNDRDAVIWLGRAHAASQASEAE